MVAVLLQHAVGDGRLRPRCRHPANWTKHTSRLWFWPILCIIWKRDVIHETGSTYHVALPSEEDRATATNNLYRKFLVKFGRVVCELRNGKRQTNSQTSRQTERYADHNTLHFIHIYASCSGRHGVGQGNINILQHLQSNWRSDASTTPFLILPIPIQFYLNIVTNKCSTVNFAKYDMKPYDMEMVL